VTRVPGASYSSEVPFLDGVDDVARRGQNRGSRALKVVACPVIVGWRRFNLKKHSRAHGAAQEDTVMTGIESREPSVTNFTSADKTF
jgi:hypothetical protein